MANIQAVASKALASSDLVLSRLLPHGKRQGSEWVSINPKRADKTTGSFKVNTRSGQWSDFATGDKGGDLVSLYAYLHDTNQGEAADQLAIIVGVSDQEGCKPLPKPKKTHRTVTAPDFKAAAHQLAEHWIAKGFKPAALHTYSDINGRPIYWRVRLKHQNGDKRVFPMRQDSPGVFALAEPEFPMLKPIYGLFKLTKRPDDTVFVVEGENCADELLKRGILATTSGSATSANSADWSPLAGRSIIIWPDNDPDGKEYARKAAAELLKIATSVHLVSIECLNLPSKGDCVDWLLSNPNATAETIKAIPTVSASSLLEADPALLSVLSVHAQAEWPEPQPIGGDLIQVETLSPLLIPEPYRDWLSDISDRMQCPIDFVSATAIVMTGAAIGAGCGIKPKREDDWLVIPNLWGGVVGSPSRLKSPSLNAAMYPLTLLERRANQEHEEAIKAHEAEKEAFEANKAAVRERMRKSAGKDPLEMDRAKREFSGLQEPRPPIWRRYKSNDATIEKMSELLRDNPRGLLLFRDELIGLLSSWDKEGHESDRAFYLEAWNGYGSITTDRINRGTTHTENLCISVFGGIQPAKLTGYLYRAMRGSDNDGLMQRIQLLVYPDDQKYWKLVDRKPNQDAQSRAFEIVKRLTELDFINCGALFNDGDKAPWFRFDADAQALFYEWWTELEQSKLRGDRESIVTEHLGKYRSLMPSLALIFHLIDIADGKPAGPVSLRAAKLAAAWCEYLESHAKRIYGLISDITPRAAANLCQHIKKGDLSDTFNTRELYRRGWELLLDKDVAEGACEMLKARGWLRDVTPPYEAGRPPATTYQINPKVIKAEKNG